MARTVHEYLIRHAETMAERPAVRYKRGGAWRELTWRQLAGRAGAVSAALVASGTSVGDRVAVLSNTRVEWTIADLGIIGAGAVTVPIYQSNTPQEAAYILSHSGAGTIFVEDASQLAKIREIRPTSPALGRIVVIDPEAAGEPAELESTWEQLLAEGDEALTEASGGIAEELARRRGHLEASDLATIIYTSGTTGTPKGVRVTHDNLVAAAESTGSVGVFQADDIQLLFLPLAHSFAKLLQTGWLYTGGVMAYAESIDKVVENMAEVRPTFMASVPRVFEKVHARVVGSATAQGGLGGRLARWAFAHGERAAQVEHRGGRPGGLGWRLARALVFGKVGRRLEALFGGRLRFFVSGGAPLAPEIAWFFRYAGVEICEGYGLTETSSVTTFNLPGRVKIGTVGPPLPGVELELGEDREIMIRGRTVFDGYWQQPEATAEVLRSDGWFLTGDVGEIDAEGYLTITDRKKDLIITAGGKNVAPQHIENLLKSRSPLVSQVVLFGDRRPYLVCLVTLDEAALREWAAKENLAGEHAELVRRPEVRRLVAREIEAVNRQLPRYETVKRFDLLDHDFTVGDQLTPTLKVRRKQVNARYRDLFERLYTEATLDVGEEA